MCSRFYQWYQWYTNIVQCSTNGTIGNTIGSNGNANGTIGSPNGTIGEPMVPLATNGTIGKITNGTIGRAPNRAHVLFTWVSYADDWSNTAATRKLPMVPLGEPRTEPMFYLHGSLMLMIGQIQQQQGRTIQFQKIEIMYYRPVFSFGTSFSINQYTTIPYI